MSIGPTSDSSVTRQIGVFGGTFDPVHNGHLAIAESVRNELGLDMVLFVVAADQWIRSIPPVAGADDRLTMVRLAVENTSGFVASDVDIARGGPTYTVDTLTDLRDRQGKAAELNLIVGADSAMSMDRWKRAEAVVSLARVVVVGRPGVEFDGQSFAESHPASGAVYVEGPMVGVSATVIRGLVQAGKSITGSVPGPVGSYIEAEGLYR